MNWKEFVNTKQEITSGAATRYLEQLQGERKRINALFQEWFNTGKYRGGQNAS